jgi:hypothetical protein
MVIYKMKERKCPYCDTTTFKFKKKDIKFVCVKCGGVVYNHDNPQTEKEGDIK